MVQRAHMAPRASALYDAARAFHRQPAVTLVNVLSAWPPEITTLELGGGVESVCYSAGHGAMLAAAVRREVRIFDAATGELVTTLQGHSRDVTCCAWSTDGGLIATGSYVRVLWLHNSYLPDHGIADSIPLSQDGTLKIWDAATGARLRWA